MSIYLGLVRMTESERGIFYNFSPLAEQTPEGYRILSTQELSDLFLPADWPDLQLTCLRSSVPEIYAQFLDSFITVDFQNKDSWYIETRSRYVLRQKDVLQMYENGEIRIFPFAGFQDRQTVEALRAEQEALTQELEALRRQNEALSLENRELTQANGKLKEQEAALMEARGRMQEEIQELEPYHESLRDQVKQSEREKDRLEKQKNSLERQRARLEAYFQDAALNPLAKLGTLRLDCQLAGRIQQAFDVQKEEAPPPAVFQGQPYEPKRLLNLPHELCERVQAFRPGYSPLDILNVAVCLTQGFLTVFFGPPGCGKTSICNIFAEVLGLSGTRYVPVSVERGWMSKRDFIGYFNPLTRTFDSSNRQIYDALRLLDAETEYMEDGKTLCAVAPFLILLDEANLSSMEYYWADFMNLCEDSLISGRMQKRQGGKETPRQIRGTVNLGEEQLEIPDWLRFAATINTDHTTETLSPRLIDRAWLVSLPDAGEDEVPAARQQEKKPEPLAVSWPAMREVFGGSGGKWEGSPSQKAFQEIAGHLQNHCGIAVSHRVRQAVRQYWTGALRPFSAVWVMKNLPYDNPRTAALDYAVAQRVLPQLQGSGPDFAGKLDELKALCEKYKLEKSAGLVQKVRARGEETEYFQFF